MEDRTCLFQDCDKPAGSRQLCQTHYGMWYRSGGREHIAKHGRAPRGNASLRPTIFVDCHICGAGVPLRRGVARQFCSRECYAQWRVIYLRDYAEAQRRASAARLKNTVLTCKHCGSEFKPADSRERYCSKLCFNRYRYANAKGRCSVEGCETAVRARGLCWKHYKRWAVDSGRMKRAPEPWTEARKAAYQARRARKRGADAEVFESVEIFERDNWLCGICGTPVDAGLVWPDPWSATLDHVVPLSKGGPHTRANTQLAHARCNLSKGNSIDSELDDLTA